MAEITVGDDTLDVEIIAVDTESQFYIRVEYEDPTGERRRNEWQLDVDKRRELTIDWIEQTLSEWTERRDDVASLASFSIQRVDVARRGANIDAGSATSNTDDQPIDPATATSDLPYAQGDRSPTSSTALTALSTATRQTRLSQNFRRSTNSIESHSGGTLLRSRLLMVRAAAESRRGQGHRASGARYVPNEPVRVGIGCSGPAATGALA